MPRTPKPKILGPWKAKPKLGPGFKVGKAGPKSKRAGMYVAKRITDPKVDLGPMPPRPLAPAAPTGPYPEYAEYPALQRQMLDLDAAQQHHEGYVSNQVMPWQAAALQGLNAFGTQAQDQLLAQLQAAGQGAFNAAAAAAPLGVSATTPGGVVAGPYAYLNQAESQRAAGLGSAATAIGQHQAAMAKIQPATLAQGFVNQLADYARGLPDLYTTKRTERRAKIDEFIAKAEEAQAEQALKEAQFAFEQVKFDETLRSNRVDESIRATNAESNAAIAFGNLGLRAEDIAADNAPPTYYDSLPDGFTQLPDGDIVRTPGAGSSGSASQKYTRNWFLEKGWKKVPPKAGPATKKNAITATDGSGLWLKPQTASAASKSKIRTTTDLQKELAGLYKENDIGGWWDRYSNDSRGGAIEVARWIREQKRNFIAGGVSGRKVDFGKLNAVLGRIGGEVGEEASRILAGYIANGVWK